jgi:hypothetical protein
MKFNLIAKAASGALIVAGLSASAAMATTLSSANLNAPGDGLLTRDSATLLEWLDVTATTGLSRLDILNDVGGWITAGFRLATRAEVFTLWSDHGFPVIDGSYDTANDPFFASFVALVGQTLNNGSVEGVVGYSADSPGPGGAFIPQVLHDLQADGDGTALILGGATGEATASNLVGSWLVREYTVAAPASLGMFGIALAGLAVGVRRRDSRSR